MFKKLLTLLCFFYIAINSIQVNAEDFKYAEIFDPKQDKVVKVVQLNPEIQNMISSWIAKVDSLYKNDPATDDGYAVRIPLDPAVKVNCTVLKALVSEVYVLIPEKEPPCYLIFDNEYRLISLVFNGDIDKLSKMLDFKLRK